MAEEADLGFSAGANREFTTTHWSVVLAAGDPASPRAAEAIEKLCRTYWYPLYAYVRRKGYAAHDAQDLTQAFFARLLEKKALVHIQREGGKFRSFLLTALNHFLVNEWEHRRAKKRDAQQVAFSLDDWTRNRAINSSRPTTRRVRRSCSTGSGRRRCSSR